MKQKAWMIYGATGYTGQLIARAAMARGLQPILAGRDASSLERTAKEFGLPWRIFSLEDKTTIRQALDNVDLLVNTAGPFRHTAVIIAESCLSTSTHYFDVSHEIPPSVAIHMLDAEAKQKGLTLLPGLGFSAAASNCLVKSLYDLLPTADCLEIALEPFSRIHSNGANLTLLDGIASGGFRRREGELQRYWLGSACRQVKLPTGVRTLVPTSLGDVEAAYRCTGIPNVTAYLAFDAPPYVLGVSLSLGQAVLSLPFVHALFRSRISSQCITPEPADHTVDSQSMVWARAVWRRTSSVEGWLRLGEINDFTAAAVVAGVLQLLENDSLPVGVHTPATAFGADFILGLPGVERRVEPVIDAESRMGGANA